MHCTYTAEHHVEEVTQFSYIINIVLSFVKINRS